MGSIETQGSAHRDPVVGLGPWFDILSVNLVQENDLNELCNDIACVYIICNFILYCIWKNTALSEL